MNKSRDSVPPALFDDLLLHFRDSPAIENMIDGRNRSVYCRFNSRRQLIYRIAHGLAEVVRLLSIHSPVEGFTDISTGKPKFDVVLLIGHRVLTMCEPGTSHRRMERNSPGSW